MSLHVMDNVVEEVSVDSAISSTEKRGPVADTLELRTAYDAAPRHFDGIEKPLRLPSRLLRPSNPQRTRAVALASGDLIAILASTAFGYAATDLFRNVAQNIDMPIEVGSSGLVSAMFLIPGLAILWLSWSWGHYTRFRPTWTEFQEILKMIGYVFVADTIVLFVLKDNFSRLWVGFFLLFLALLMPTMRHLSRALMIRLGCWMKSTYVVGTGRNAEMTAIALESDIALGHRVDGFINLSESSRAPYELVGKQVFNGLPHSSVGIRVYGERPCLVFAFDSLSEYNTHRGVVNQHIAASSYATISPPISGLPLYGSEVLTIFKQDAVLLKIQNNINNPRARFVKRTFDIIFSALLIIVFSPIMLGLFLLIRNDGYSATYGHKRIGRSGKAFSCLKFRSMVENGDYVLNKHFSETPEARLEWDASRKLTNDPRVTRIGHVLRKTSLDELPQLLNVLKGEMSLVGPRPIVQDEVIQYGDHFTSYLSMTPGITGLWQTSGRSDTSYRERVMLDVWYARNWSLWYDVVILLRTIPALLKQAGAR